MTFRRLSALSAHQVAELCVQANRVAARFQLAAEDLCSTPNQSPTVHVDDGTEHSVNEMQCPQVQQTVSSSSVLPPLVTEAGAGEPDLPPRETKGKLVPLVRRSQSAVKENKAPTLLAMRPSARKASSGVSEASNCHVSIASFCSVL